MNTENKNDGFDKLVSAILSSDRMLDLSKITNAYDFAKKAHKNQIRQSGEPYISHPVSVAYILAVDIGMDTNTICAALLHDVVEDTEYTFDDIKKRFGLDVATLVDGVTKLATYSSYVKNKDEKTAENVKKLLLSIANDVRIIIIKLADRLHNVRTLGSLGEEKQKRIARDTLEIYVSLADMFGIFNIKEELQDRAFKIMDPIAYREIEETVGFKKSKRNSFIEDKKKIIIDELSKTNIFFEPPFVDGRVKSIYSIYRKTYRHGKQISEIFDTYALRIIVNTLNECYSALGVMHQIFKPIDGRYKDYIASPKKNGYQSIHTTVIGKDAIPFEVQIRTYRMHHEAEYGIAAHWKYKEKEGFSDNNRFEKQMAVVRATVETVMLSDNPDEAVETVKEISSENIVVLTPRGDTVDLPVGSTVVDFAYRIHTELGHSTHMAKANKKIVPLDYVLQNGDVVEIMTLKGKGPNKGWLNFVKTNDAKIKIRKWFKDQCRPENIIVGKELLEKELRRNQINIPEDKTEEFFSDYMQKYNCKNLEDFYAVIGYGGLNLSNIMLSLYDKYVKLYVNNNENSDPLHTNQKNKRNFGTADIITIDNVSGIATRFAKCCNPLPGDKLVGFTSRTGFLVIHNADCDNYKLDIEKGENLDRWRPVEWTGEGSKYEFESHIRITATDRIGLNYDILGIFVETKTNIIQSSSRNIDKVHAVYEATITIPDVDKLKFLFTKLKNITGVISVERTNQ
ncbi:MAG: bifunctional (p)ppGpp synthetase/guanosine-3',5'-bis(diphosphate) 3'-pyrophosphohydrolase [Ruminococcus sp.]|jgi:GTP pyrophosphokinase|nr:bifunctional (p)ppGpp synthetase/guanosine-3',5'-bis(diphosphate) 3'-pyrophosphohydrolase [Ruminococcus sp.]